MTTLLKLAFVLAMLASFALSPISALADNVGPSAVPDCVADPEACQAMLAQYVETYGPLPEEKASESEPAVAADIAMTEGQDPPADVLETISRIQQELQDIARRVCVDPDNEGWQEYIRTELAAGVDQETVLSKVSSASGYLDIEETYLWTMHALSERDGYSVPSRMPTFTEAIAPYTGCDTGEYQGK